jgi:hypothetical protein
MLAARGKLPEVAKSSIFGELAEVQNSELLDLRLATITVQS